MFDFSRTLRGVNTDFFFNFSDIFLISPTSDPSDFLLNRAVRAVPEPIHNFCFGEMICCVYIVVILSPTKLGRDIVTLPSFRNILVNTLESTSFNGF